MSYTNNLKIADLTLTINPEQYSQQFKKYGSYKRSIGGGIVNINMMGKKLVVEIKGVTQDQVEAIKLRCAINQTIPFVDYIPIAEEQKTRSSIEDISTNTVEGTTVYLYVPEYQIVIFDFIPEYSQNLMTYVITGEEL